MVLVRQMCNYFYRISLAQLWITFRLLLKDLCPSNKSKISYQNWDAFFSMYKYVGPNIAAVFL